MVTANKITIPTEATEPDFLAALRDSYVQQEPTARRLLIATDLANDLGRACMDGALSIGRVAMRELLLGKLSYQPDEDDLCFDDEPAPDHRTPAAFLFLYGVAAGYWKATAKEKELARALVIAKYGMEALDMFKPEKTKTDLAREAGVPNKTFVHKTRQDGRSSKQIVEEYLDLERLADAVERAVTRRPIDDETFFAAVKNYLNALKQYFPAAYEAQTAQMRDKLAPVAAKRLMELGPDAIAMVLG